jgi:hypothetical protein
MEDRDFVVHQLSEHFAADRISVEELERRLDLVYNAASPQALAAITADLPPIVHLPTARVGRGAPFQRIKALLSNVERGGLMDVPSRLDIRATLGNVELDLRDASFGPFTEISIRSVLGNVEITLPLGVRIENDGEGILGSFGSHVAPGTMPMVGTAPIVRLTGRCILGNVEVRSVTASAATASAMSTLRDR